MKFKRGFAKKLKLSQKSLTANKLEKLKNTGEKTQ